MLNTEKRKTNRKILVLYFCKNTELFLVQTVRHFEEVKCYYTLIHNLRQNKKYIRTLRHGL